ncbi:NUDIX domain-containing protein [Streptomyces sp. HF10]|uniref:NUDIX domain-containing protein n=1 Tax=Streptomyces sp. HF10 TaxID=2692233 RepID=UPI001F331E3C|nr:NUDIX domain-containing protein [Streptomyces sp. HF10]
MVGAVVSGAGRVLLVRRKPGDSLGGLWELPSGKVEEGEGLLEALYRGTAEEIGLAVRQVGDSGADFDHAVTVERAGPVVLTEHDAHRR